MNNIVLMSDTACDLSDELIEKHHITLIPFYLSFNQTDYVKEKVELSIADFYQRMREEKIFPKTSLPSIDDYYRAFEDCAKVGKSIICVTISGCFSGSYNSAVNARELILENYPDTSIEIINSLTATGNQGLLVLEIARMIENGLPFTQIVKLANDLRSQSRIYFYVDTLDYLEHGGRIGKASALLGNMLNVKPVLCVVDGEIQPVAKVRGKKKAMAKLIELSAEYTANQQQNFNYAICHGDSLTDAETLKNLFNSQMSVRMSEDYALIGTTIGVYTGPSVAGIAMMPKYETRLDDVI